MPAAVAVASTAGGRIWNVMASRMKTCSSGWGREKPVAGVWVGVWVGVCQCYCSLKLFAAENFNFWPFSLQQTLFRVSPQSKRTGLMRVTWGNTGGEMNRGRQCSTKSHLFQVGNAHNALRVLRFVLEVLSAVWSGLPAIHAAAATTFVFVLLQVHVAVPPVAFLCARVFKNRRETLKSRALWAA